MAAEKTPAFQFYPKDFLASDAVSLMTTEQIGAYTLLLCHSWLRPEGLPSDLSSLSKLARVPVARFTGKVWPALIACFVARPNGLLENRRLERERVAQETHRLERSQSGKRGAAQRWAIAQPSSENGSAINQPLAKNSSSSSSASSSASTTTKNVVVAAQQPPPKAQPLHGRRNPDLMTYGPIPLWASQFRDGILPLVATHFGGSRDDADRPARAWIAELDTANQTTLPAASDVREPAQWWSAQAVTRWSAPIRGVAVLTEAQLAEREAQQAAERDAKQQAWSAQQDANRKAEQAARAAAQAVAPQRIAELRVRLGKAAKSL